MPQSLIGLSFVEEQKMVLSLKSCPTKSEKKPSEGDCHYQEQTFKTTAGNVTFNVGTSGLTAINNPMTVTFDLSGGTHSSLAGAGISFTDKGVTATPASSSSSEGLAGLIQVSSNRSAKDISVQTRTGKATVEVFDATVRCNEKDAQRPKECS